MKIFRNIADDEFGSVDTMGYVLMVTLLAIGGITGLATLRDGIIQEGGDIGQALQSLNHGYNIWIPDDSGLPANLDTHANMVEIAYAEPATPPAVCGINLTTPPGGEGTPASTSSNGNPYFESPGPGGESAGPAAMLPDDKNFPPDRFPKPSPLGEGAPLPPLLPTP